MAGTGAFEQAMQILYNSEHFAVVRFEVAAPQASHAEPGHAALAGWNGFEIVDKRARKEVFLTGALAERFQQGAQELAQKNSPAEAFDEFIAGFAEMSQQALTLH